MDGVIATLYLQPRAPTVPALLSVSTAKGLCHQCCACTSSVGAGQIMSSLHAASGTAAGSRALHTLLAPSPTVEGKGARASRLARLLRSYDPNTTHRLQVGGCLGGGGCGGGPPPLWLGWACSRRSCMCVGLVWVAVPTRLTEAISY
jgi:hypothetical protein